MPNSVDERTVLSQPHEAVATDLTHCPVCGAREIQKSLAAPDRFHGRSTYYQMMRCARCEIVWTSQPPRPAEMDLHYGPDYDRLISKSGQGAGERWQKRREALAQFKPGGALLDLGCSSGSFLATLDRNAWRLSGIEISPEYAREAKARTGADVFCGDILDAPFQPASFDAVTCFHVFEHLYQPRIVMEKVRDWLKPGGIFYTIVPNIDSAGARIFRSYWYPLELPRHLYHFSPASLRHLAGVAGLEVVSLETHRELFIEPSMVYISNELLKKLGITRAPMAKAEPPGFVWKAIRKVLRMTVFAAFSGMASAFGDRESIHIVLRKKSLPKATA